MLSDLKMSVLQIKYIYMRSRDMNRQTPTSEKRQTVLSQKNVLVAT